MQTTRLEYSALRPIGGSRQARWRSFVAGASGVVLLMGATAMAVAAQWEVEPTVRAQAFYDDNVRVTAAGEDAAWGTIVSPAVVLHRRTERSAISVEGALDFRRYPDEPDLDSDDQALNLRSELRGERDVWRLEANAKRDSTLTSELEDTGLLQDRSRRRQRYAIAPAWARALSETTTLQLNYAFADVRYEENVSGLVDYQYQELGAALLRRLDPRNTLNFGVTASRLDVPDNDLDTDTVGVQVGLQSEISETLKSDFLIGVRRSKAEFGPTTARQSDESTGLLLSAGVEKQFELTSLTARLSRSLQPSGAGQLNQSDRVDVSLRRRITPLLSFWLDATGIEHNAVGGGFSITDRTYLSVQPALRWRLSERWNVVAGYRFIRSKRDDADQAAESNRAMISVTYSWQKAALP